MDPARWTRLSDLVADALSVLPPERVAVLAAEPDETLRAEAAALAAAHDEADALGALDTPFASSDGAALPLPGPVGPWRPTARLGAGGMGVVYTAEREGEGFVQRAALKLVRPGFGADFRARFVRERALLAGLDHPGVARLLDGGLTADGLPYLAMELVEGQPITAYAESRSLGVRDRVRLFVQACEAVAHAHQRLVVHRDLKPAHVLVTEGERGAPRVKLLDFGVAKLLSDDDAEALTRTGGGPLTLQYAAPEQLVGQPVTTATDVYALGAILYEMLAGRRPYDLAGQTAAEAERTVREHTPAPPAAVAGGRTWGGDLDTVVLKALEKDPARRYPSADALAADLRRMLSGLPIEARPATARYRIGRFVRRHRVGVAAAATTLAALVIGLGAALWQGRLAASERDRAQAEAAKAEAVNEFMSQVLTAADGAWYTDSDAAGPDVTVAAVLDAAAARLDREPPADPLVEAAARRSVGSAYRSLTRLDEAAAQLERSVALYRARLHPPHPDLAHAVHDLGHVRYFQGRYDDAARLLGEARAQWAATHDAPDRWLFAYTNDAANPLLALGRTDEAAALFEQAAAIGRDIPDVPENAVAIAVANILGARLKQRRYREADSLAREVVALFEAADDGQTFERSAALRFVAEAARHTGQPARADLLARRVLDGLLATVGETSPYTVDARITLAWIALDDGRTTEAETLADRALSAAAGVWDSPNRYHARAYHVRGATRAARGDLGQAEADLRVAVSLFDDPAARSPSDEATAALDLADVLRRRGAPTEAAVLARRALDVARDTAPGPDDALVARAEATVRAPRPGR